MSQPSRERRPGSTRSRGRGAAAAFGFILLFTGLIGGGAMFVYSLRLHDEAVEGFARAGVGCTTSLQFGETGTFYVYQETAGFEWPHGGCEPKPTPGQPFAVRFVDPDTVVLLEDDSIDYDTDEFTGRSVARFEIVEEGNYELDVRGDTVEEWAAIGRDPSAGVDDWRTRAIVVAIAGVVLGGLLLALAGRRSKRAATPSIPEGPGWGQRPGQGMAAWPPEPPRVPQVPVNPHQPDTPASVAAPPPPLPARAPGSATPPRSPWAAPAPDSAPVRTDPPVPTEQAKPPDLPPKLPE